MNATDSHASSIPAGRSRPKPSDVRRKDIVSAAYDLYQEKGLSHTTIKDVTQRVGVTRTLFYHYFPNKEALTLAVLDVHVDDFIESLRIWNSERHEGDVESALKSAVRLLRLSVFENDPFHVALASRENASLYLAFLDCVADHTASYIIDTTVRDYAARHEVRIQHLHETFYILIVGAIGYLRNHPDADDAVVADVIAQTLHMDRTGIR